MYASSQYIKKQFTSSSPKQINTQKDDIPQIYYRFRLVRCQLAQMCTVFVAKGARVGSVSRKVEVSIPNGANMS
jgi:hypothetical protein